MNKNKYPFMFRYAKEKKGDIFEYLGADGVPTDKTYASYLEICEEFRTKAKKYAKDNLHLKNSTLPYVKIGYETSEQLEQEILLKREQQLMEYNKAFNPTFNDDINKVTGNFTGKSKKIRVIRELNQQRRDSFSDNFDEKGSSWFTRYCILSRFIQAVRKIILLKRLEKALASFKAIKSRTSQKYSVYSGSQSQRNSTRVPTLPEIDKMVQ